jgi:protein TonB
MDDAWDGTGPRAPREERETMSHVRFETWLMVPEELAERRRRLMMSAMSAAVLSMGLGLASWTADKLGISPVTPPKHSYAVTLQVLEPPPPPAPPPAVAAAAKSEPNDRAAAPDEPVPPEPDEAPSEVLELDLDARPRVRATVPSSAGPGGGGGITGIPSGGGNRCLLPPCIGTTQVVGRSEIPQPKPPASEPVQAPIKAVMASSIFTPDPDKARLSRTTTGRTHPRPGKTTVAFCIDGNGKTFEVRTRRGFPGDAEVDEICRATVSKWRFWPQRVAGKARTTCTSVTFDIRFE